MNVGTTMRYAFERMISIMGEPILIHKGYGTPNPVVTEVRGMKNNEKNRPKEVMFQFLSDPGVVVGDVLQQPGSRDFWRVTEIHDDVVAGVFQHFEARVENLSAFTPARNPAIGHTVVVHGHVHGGIQLDSPGATQNNDVRVTQITNDIGQLKALFASSALPDLEKEDAAIALNRITELAARPQSPDLLAKISSKIGELKTLAAGVASLTVQAAPLLKALWERFGQ